MTRVVVTGAAGFIGSHLSEALASRGYDVVAIDCFTPYYDRSIKESNLESVAASGCDVLEQDLLTADLPRLLDGVDAVFHLAGQPGVRLSWADGFPEYDRLNIALTQSLLEAAKISEVRRFVYSSSSSVYGDAERFPTTERVAPSPVSPYGVTKLAGEHLATLYGRVWGLGTISLRYFTVYGPRQRPDMAFNRLLEATLGGAGFELFGDGTQVRDFTYVADVVAANVAALEVPEVPPGSVVNVSGGSAVDMLEVLRLVEDLAGTPPPVTLAPRQPGDARRTGGDATVARTLLGWSPSTTLETGLRQQLEWHRARRSQT